MEQAIRIILVLAACFAWFCSFVLIWTDYAGAIATGVSAIFLLMLSDKVKDFIHSTEPKAPTWSQQEVKGF